MPASRKKDVTIILSPDAGHLAVALKSVYAREILELVRGLLYRREGAVSGPFWNLASLSYSRGDIGRPGSCPVYSGGVVDDLDGKRYMYMYMPAGRIDEQVAGWLALVRNAAEGREGASSGPYRTGADQTG